MKSRVRDRTKFQVNLNIFKILSIVLIVIFIFFTPTLIQKLIKITRIECSTQFGQCQEDFRLGDYRTIKKQIEKQLSGDIQVNTYLVQYKIPSTIKIELDLKKPSYSVKDQSNKQSLASSAGKFYLVDASGKVIDNSNESNLPTLVVNESSYKVGDTISDKDMFALKLIEKVNWLYGIREGTIDKNTLNLQSKEGILIIFPLEGDVDVLTGSLRLIFSRLNDSPEGIRMEDVREIDLRFSNPVLR